MTRKRQEKAKKEDNCNSNKNLEEDLICCELYKTIT